MDDLITRLNTPFTDLKSYVEYVKLVKEANEACEKFERE
jgi:hypothetical protein